MNFPEMARIIDEKVCFGTTETHRPGHAEWSICPWYDHPLHRHGFLDPWNVPHFTDRRWTRRGARNFLLLIAGARRFRDPGFLNEPRLSWYHVYIDHKEMDRMAAQCGFRIPARLSARERSEVFYLAAKDGQHLARDYPAVYKWADGVWRIKR